MKILLRHVAVGVAALSAGVMFLRRDTADSEPVRWFEDELLTDLTPVSSEWLRDNVRDRGQRGE